MKIKDIIAKIDFVEPNQYDNDQKMEWLSALDGKIFLELIMTHHHPHCIEFVPYTDIEQELLVGAPYDNDLYGYFLQMKIADFNQETILFNKQATLYNNAYQEYANYYNRTHMPITHRNRFRF